MTKAWLSCSVVNLFLDGSMFQSSMTFCHAGLSARKPQIWVSNKKKRSGETLKNVVDSEPKMKQINFITPVIQ